MPRPGFYNDNEYRAYPFIYDKTVSSLPDNVIVDAGIVMRIDSNFDGAVHSVWLASVSRAGTEFTFEFQTDATEEPLTFTCLGDAGWQIKYAESAVQNTAPTCANKNDPVWEGFIVVGPVQNLTAFLSDSETVTFTKTARQLEPGRIQNLCKAYLRTINLGNYERPYVPNCDEATPGVDVLPDIVINRTCMAGNLRLKEGYNCVIKQKDWRNEITISAVKGAGAEIDPAFCENGSELALFPGESLFENNVFYSRGPACSDLISSINGLPGPSITLVGGDGINIKTQADPPKITLTRNITAAGNCGPGATP
jgi:hypothetical protein